MTSRRLLYVPVVHTQADMGSMSQKFEQAAIRQMGRAAWRQHQADVERYWDSIEEAISALTLDYLRTRLYQDALPVCGKEREIATEAAKAGSRNYCLLLSLHEKGAILMGTESGTLLLEEYTLTRQKLEEAMQEMEGVVPSRQTLVERAERERLLLISRDRFLATRIHETLEPGETAILFLGAIHNPAPMFASDIEVLYFTHQPEQGGTTAWQTKPTTIMKTDRVDRN